MAPITKMTWVDRVRTKVRLYTILSNQKWSGCNNPEDGTGGRNGNNEATILR